MSNQKFKSWSYHNSIPAFLALSATLLAGTVRAATVTNSADLGPGSLREVIANAVSGDTIDFAVTGPIVLTSGELMIDKDLTVQGPGSGSLTIQRSVAPGTPEFRIFHIQTAAVTLSGLTMHNGRADFGGGVLNESTAVVLMRDVILSTNSATTSGGGFYNDGELMVEDSAFLGNSVLAIDGTGAYGGGLANWGGINFLDRCRFEGNSASGGDGAGGGFGGALNNSGSIWSMDGGVLRGNSAAGGPGGGYASGGAINNDYGTLTLTNCTLSGNSVTGGAGGASAFGGGLNNDYGSVYVDASTVRDNVARGGSGSGGGLAEGGGVGNGFGTVELARSTVSGNLAVGGAGDNGGTGGGGGVANDYGTLYLYNSTVSGNIANGGAGTVSAGVPHGGGLFNGFSSVSVSHSTIAANVVPGGAADDGGGIYNLGGFIDIKNTIVAANNATVDVFNDNYAETFSDGFNAIGSTGFNGVGWFVAGPSDQFNLTAATLLMGPLQDNGGPTFTHALLCGSPALNAGDNTGAPATDQRGFQRIVGSAIDIGAYEARITVPTISCPSPITLNCAPPSGMVATVSVNVADADGDSLVVVWTLDGTAYQTNVVAAGGPPTDATVGFTNLFGIGSHELTVAVSDSGGCRASCSTTVEVSAFVLPTVANCPADATIACPATPVFGTPVFSSVCDTNLTVTFADQVLAVSGKELSKTKRTWTATDAQTNSVTCSQTITVMDNVAPTVANCPTDATIECPATAAFGTPTFSDACDSNLTITFADQVLAVSGKEISKTKRTWTATDAKNNSATCSQTITVMDNAAPTVANCPTDATIECPATAVFGTPTFSDACDNNLTITFADQTLAVSGKEISKTKRTWTATDAKNNSATCSQTITVMDNAAPTVANCPTDATVECPATPAFGTPTFSDACDNNLTITFADQTLAVSGKEISKTKRTWTATDAKNNSATCSQTITVMDNAAPTVANCPGDSTIECPATAVFGTPTFSDACDNNLTITFADQTLAVSGKEISKTKRTWTATDAKNNSATCSQTITVMDNAAPTVANCPTDATIQCPATAVFGTPQFSDLCDANLTVTFADEVLSIGGKEVSKTKRTWTATDARNNSVTCSQTITVMDSAAPTVANCPTDATIQCPATPAFGTPQFSDLCDANLTVTFADEVLSISGKEISKTKRTWTATDAKNNSVTCSQTITVSDTTAPVVSCPANSSLAGNTNCQAAVPNVLNGATDNCSSAGAITLSQSPAAGTMVGLGAHTITVTATDAVGNSATCTTIFTVTGSATLTVACPVVPDVAADANCQAAVPNILSGVTASGGCAGAGNINVSQSPAAGTLVSAGVHTITVTATNSAGDSATCTSTFTVTGSGAAINIVTLTEDTNNDFPTGPHLITDSTVTWTYLVTNPGCEPLTNIVVTDSVAGVVPAYQDGDANLNGQLESSETWTYAASGIVGLGQYTNIGTVTATGTATSASLTNSNPDHYFGDPTPCPAGLFTYSVNATNGDLEIKFYQFPAPNDNSYGVNAVGWEKGHTFDQLVGSDKAGFQLRNPSGVVVLDFWIDTLSVKAGTPSGYGSLGPWGGDGSVIKGTLTANDITFETSIERNLNKLGYFVNGAQTAATMNGTNGANLFLNSPPTRDTLRDYTLKTPNPWTKGWDFKNSYYVTIKKAKLDSLGFNAATWHVEPDLAGLHNSPAKPCPIGVVGAQFLLAKGGDEISADGAVTNVFTTLTGPVYTEDVAGQIGLGTIVIKPSAGFVFDTGGTPPTVLVSKLSGSQNKPVEGSITSVTATQITYTVTKMSVNQSSLTWQNIRVRPTSGTPLISGYLSRSGTANVIGLPVDSYLGTLQEIAGAPRQLAMLVQPSDTAMAGVPFTQQPAVLILDQFGNLRSSANGVDDHPVVTATRLAGSGTLQGTTNAAGSDGVVVFTNLSHNVATNITIRFSIAGATPVTSDPIAVGVGSLSCVAFVTQPGNAVVGSAFGTQPVIQSQDAFGNSTTIGLPASLPVTLSLSSGTGPLQGTTTVDLGTAAGNGTVAFSDLQIDSSGTDKRLTASATGLSSGVSSVFSVARLNQTIAFGGLASKTYGDAPFTVAASASSGLPVSFSVVSGPATVAGNVVTLTGPGTVAIRAVQSGNATYWNPATSVDQSFSVAQKVVTGNITANNKPYDGTTAATIATRTLSGVVGSDVVSLTGGIAAFADKNVGSGKTVTATGLSLTGTAATKYLLASTTAAATADITARALSVTATSVNKVYDGSTSATATLSDNRVSGDVLTTSYSTATFANKNVGTAKTVSVSGIAVSGTSAANYTANTTATASANITAKGLTVSGVTANNKPYDGTTTATLNVASAASSGVVSGDDVTFNATGATGTFASKTVGTAKLVTISGLSLGGIDAANYTVTQPGTTADITKAALTVKADNKTRAAGAVNPTLTATYSSFVGGETLATSGVTGSPALSTTTTNVAGTYPITAAIGTLTSANYSFNLQPGQLTVTAATATKLVMQTQPSSTASAGVAFAQQPQIRVEDQYGNFLSTDNGRVITVARSAGSGTLQGTLTATTVNGVATFANLSHNLANTITLSFTSTGLTSATSGNIVVSPTAFAKLQLLVPGEIAAPGSATGKTGTPTASTAGTALNVTVNAVDSFWNVINTVTDTVDISSTDAYATLPADTALVSGTKTLSVTFKTTGSKTLTATDVTDGSKSANTSPSITVNAGVFVKMQLLVPGETAAPGTTTGKTGAPTAQSSGTAFNVTVNAVDANWNVVSSIHTVGITTTDPGDTHPANAALAAGTRTFAVTLMGVGSWTITTTDITDGTKTANTSPAITVNAGAFAKLQILLPGETAAPGTATGKTGTPTAQTAGTPFNVTVKAVDASWNPINTVTDTVGITSSDANAVLPANAALVAGTQTFSVTLKAAGSRTVTASDVTDGSKTANTSAAVTVNAGAFVKLQLLVPGETAAPGTASGKTGTPSALASGTAYSVTIRSVDAQWNLVSSTHTVGITSTDSTATLPSSGALSAGTRTVSVTLKTIGSQTVTATDITDGSKTASTSPAINVIIGTANKLTIQTQPSSSANAGVAFAQQPVIRVEDAAGNLVTNDIGRVITATRSAGTGTLQGDLTATTVNGIATFTDLSHNVATTITLSFSASGLTSATSGNIVVSGGAATQLLFTTQPAGTRTGSPLANQPVVKAVDQFGNVTSAGLPANFNVSLAQTSGSGSLLGSTTSDIGSAAGNGTATFANVELSDAGTNKQITASALGFANAVSAAFTLDGVERATGGTAIPSSTAGGTYTTLTGPVYYEYVVGDIGTGTIIVNAPTGFVFDTGGTAPTVKVTRLSGGGNDGKNINGVASGSSAAITSRTSTQITFTVSIPTSGDVACSLIWQNIRVRPSAASPLASGNITKTGTSVMAGVVNSSTSFGRLLEIGPAARLIVQTQPSSTATAGVTFAQQPVIRIEDAAGNFLTSNNTTVVTATRSSGSGTLQGTTSRTAVNGLVTFDDLAHNVAGNITITFSSGTLTNATSTAIAVSPAAASQLAFATQPANGTFGSTLATHPVLRSRDQFGNDSTVGLDANMDVTVALSAGTGPLLGTTTLDIGTSAGNGVISFSGLQIDSAGSNKQLTASASGLTSAVSSTFTVAKANQTITFGALGSKTYGDAPITVAASASSGLPVSFSIVSGPATISGNSVNITGAGTVTVRAAQSGDANWNTATGADQSFAVAKLSVTGNITANDKTYDGTTAATIDTRNLSGVIGGDNVSLTGGTANFDNKNVGAGKSVTATGLSLSGTAAGNYQLASTSAATTADITTVALTGSITAANKPYDGTTAATIATRTLSGVAGGDAVSLVGGTASFADKSVGTGKSVTATGLSLSGADANNYELASSSAATTADITVRTLTVSASGVNKVYDATTAATVTLSDDRVSGDVLDMSYATASFADKNAGSGKTVTATGLSLSGTAAGNYQLASTSAATSADITAATLTVTAVGVNKAYDGTNTATVTLMDDRFEGDELTVSYTNASFADQNPQNGKVVSVSGIAVSGTDAGNYIANTEASTVADITGATLTVAGITAQNKVYDGTTVATLNLEGAVVEGVMSGDDVTVVADSVAGAFADAEVGTGKLVTVSGLTLIGADAAKYTLTQPTTTADITAVP